MKRVIYVDKRMRGDALEFRYTDPEFVQTANSLGLSRGEVWLTAEEAEQVHAKYNKEGGEE